MLDYDTIYLTESDKERLIQKMSDMGYVYGVDYSIETKEESKSETTKPIVNI
jgi:hypothetical protein